MSRTPTPGSRDAGSMGCTCPIIDNGHGRGYMGGLKDKDGNVVFVTQADCPLHGQPELMRGITEYDNNGRYCGD